MMRASLQNTDEELWRLALAGDEGAFTLLYRRRQGAVYRFAWQMCGSESVAEDVTQEVFMALVRDGEGATKFIAIGVEGGRDTDECDRVARAIANSPLVKTAFFASDPNLGRIVCAIGNAEVSDLDPDRVSFWLDDVAVVVDGGRAPSYREEDGKRVMAQSEISVRVVLDRGEARAMLWTCDLSHEYVNINAHYRT